MRLVNFIDDMSKDFRYAARTLRRSPSFTAVAILTLALGIGANTAVFSLVDAVLLKSLPVKDPERLLLVDAITSRGDRQNLSHPLFQRLRAENTVFVGVFAAQEGINRLEMIGPEPGSLSEEADVALVSGEVLRRARRSRPCGPHAVS